MKVPPSDAAATFRIVDDLEHARHILDRVALFTGLALQTDTSDHAQALVEVADAALTEALALFDGAMREIERRRHGRPASGARRLTSGARTRRRPTLGAKPGC
jgi:hypothetical protein